MRSPMNANALTMVADRFDRANVTGMIALRQLVPQRPRIYASTGLARKSRISWLVKQHKSGGVKHCHQTRQCVGKSATRWCSERLSCRTLGETRT